MPFGTDARRRAIYRVTTLFPGIFLVPQRLVFLMTTGTYPCTVIGNCQSTIIKCVSKRKIRYPKILLRLF